MENNNNQIINKFIDYYNMIQYNYFLHKTLAKVQNCFDEGKSFEEIKLEFDHYPDSLNFKMEMHEHEEMIKGANVFIKEVFVLATDHGYIRLTESEEFLKEIEKNKSNIILN